MKQETQALVRANLGAYLLAQNPTYTWVNFHQDYIIPALHKVANHEIEALAILMPPRHAKSRIASVHFLAWLFGRWPERSNMLLSYSDTFAKRFGRQILGLVKSEIHQEVFPECRLSANAQASSYFVTTKGGEFFSAGFNGQITGTGVSGVLVIDDPLKNMEEARSSAIILGRMEDYRSAAKTRLEGGKKLLCTTRWARGDFFDRVMDEDGMVEEGGVWTVLKIPAEAGIDDPLDRVPGQFLWPERFGERWYRDHKKSTRTWNALFQQEPDSAKGRFFKREWINFYEKRVMPGKFPAYMLTDPSKGETADSDLTAIGVFVSTPERRLLLVDAVLARLDPEQRSKECLRLAKKWRPNKWLYEEYGLMNDTWYLTRDFKKAGMSLRPIPVGRRGPRHMLSKESRIEGLIPDFREGILWLPDPARIPFPTVKLFADEEEISIIEYFIEQEICEYSGEGSIPHDDMLDMTSRLHETELNIRYPLAPAVEEARAVERNRPRRGSWESALALLVMLGMALWQ